MARRIAETEEILVLKSLGELSRYREPKLSHFVVSQGNIRGGRDSRPNPYGNKPIRVGFLLIALTPDMSKVKLREQDAESSQRSYRCETDASEIESARSRSTSKSQCKIQRSSTQEAFDVFQQILTLAKNQSAPHIYL